MLTRYLTTAIIAVVFAAVMPACVHDSALNPGATVGVAFVSDASVVVHGIT